MIKVILIHGNGGGTGQDHWFPYIQRELKNRQIECIAPDFPDSKLARSKYWLPFLEKELSADKDTILIGHSTGAVAALRYAENHQILGSIVIAVYYTDLGYESEQQSGYFNQPWDWASIKQNQQWSVVISSNNDPYIPITQPKLIAQKLGSEYIELPNKGHFGSDILELPEIIDAVINHI